MAVQSRPVPVADRANRLAWEQDAAKVGLKPAAAFIRWYWSERFQGSPAWRVIFGPQRRAGAGELGNG